MNREVNKVLAQPDIKARFLELGAEAVPRQPAEYKAMEPNATYSSLTANMIFDPKSPLAGVAGPIFDFLASPLARLMVEHGQKPELIYTGLQQGFFTQVRISVLGYLS